MDTARLRAAFPVLERITYLNAGTCGPIPAVAQRAAIETWEFATREGRSGAFYERLIPVAEQLRERYASALGVTRAQDVALTSGTSDGCGRVVAGLTLGPGDEILTADDEHPGLQGPLIAARLQRGAVLRAVPLEEVPDAVSENTKLIACSHVSWHSGAVAPVAAIVAAARARGIPVLLDGAQGVGAVPVDVASLGVAAYAGSGQKWLCGPVGCGMLWIAPEWAERIAALTPAYGGVADHGVGLDSGLVETALRYDLASQDLSTMAAAVAAFDVLAEAGLRDVQERAIGLAGTLAASLTDAGFDVVPRGATTLVSWTVPGGDEAAIAVRDRLQAAGVTVRDLPGAGRLRASAGAWNDEDDLQRLLTALM
jgi:L-cysteine/cystine lyase